MTSESDVFSAHDRQEMFKRHTRETSGQDDGHESDVIFFFFYCFLSLEIISSDPTAHHCTAGLTFHIAFY